jgi:flagellar biosynthetic protein FliP
MHTPIPSSVTSIPDAPAALPRRIGHLVRHYVEMVAAMFAGMFVLGRLESLAFPGLSLGTELDVLVMATNMAIGMGGWMRFRGHSWRSIAEMSASMYLPFAALFVPYWAGAIGSSAVMTWGHALMFPAMALVMVIHPHDYAQH